MLDWYVASTKHNQEPRADTELRRQGFETFLPRVRERYLTKVAYRTRVYFPGYIFIRFDVVRHPWGRINSTRGVSRLFTCGDLPSRIRRGVIEAMRASAENGDFVRDDRMKEIAFSAGDRVRVTAGPFRGKVGSVVNVVSVHDMVEVMLDPTQFGGLKLKARPVGFPASGLEVEVAG